jgi:hypothetical protein
MNTALVKPITTAQAFYDKAVPYATLFTLVPDFGWFLACE